MFDRWLADDDEDAADRAARSGLTTAIAASACAIGLTLTLGAAKPVAVQSVDLIPFDPLPVDPCPCDLPELPEPPSPVTVTPGDQVDDVVDGACGDTCADVDGSGGHPAVEIPDPAPIDAELTGGEPVGVDDEILCRYPADPPIVGVLGGIPAAIGPGTRPLTLRKRTPAVYPEAARALDLPDQRCVASIAVDRAGRPGQISVDGCALVFRDAARALVEGWRWYPPQIDDPRATAALTRVGVTFRRDHR